MAVSLAVVLTVARPTPVAAATPVVLGFELSQANVPGKPLAQVASDLERQSGALPSWTPAATIATEQWSLSTRIDGQTVRSAIIPERRVLALNADLSGELRVTTAPPTFPSPAHRDAWRDAGSPAAETETLEHTVFAAGEFEPMFGELSGDTDDVLAELSDAHPISQYGAAELFVAVRDVYLEQAPSADARASLLRLVGGYDSVRNLGRVVDRSGRAGVAVATDSEMSGLPTRYILVFDPSSGALLSSEEVLTETSGKLEVPIPSVISYTLFEETAN